MKLPDDADTLTMAELAAVLRMSARQANREAVETGQVAGIPVIQVGRVRRVSRKLVERMLGGETLERSA